MCMILWQNLPLYSSLTNYTKISTSMRTFGETHVKLKRRGNFIIRMRTIMAREARAVNSKYKNHFNEMKGDVGMSDQQK